MKKGLQAILLLLLASAACTDVLSQAWVRQEARRDVSAPLRYLSHKTAGLSIPQAEQEADRADEAQEVKENAAFKQPSLTGRSVPLSRSSVPHPASALCTSPLSVATSLNFDGITDVNSWSVPDTNGSAGDTQYVQWVNASFAVFDKSTGGIVLVPMA